MDYQIERLRQGAVFTITRSAHLNALNREVWRGLESCLDELEGSGGRFLLITGEGDRAFSSGSDLKDGVLEHWDQQAAKSDKIRNLLLRLSQSTIYSIAVVNGMAYGGGLELALACSQRMSASTSRFSMPEIRLGLIPSYGGTQFLPAVVGRARASELMLTGRVLNAEEALEWGIVSYVHNTRTALMDHARSIANSVASFSDRASAAVMRCLTVSGGVPTQEGMNIESSELANLISDSRAKEGIRAFLAREKPSS
ncbi:enoyl-CoA hydratase/isomerase family protein [Hydrogenophaga sp. H7]|uniref:enoyl-CoA hydratase/isomerase family protein n=1 Tax=Hydrogenophaga sp. H7 TaxID=1882399 RepID=UPI0009A32CB2|nr:enoyl-CoA hydratase/isomerase family protein [Hydrogenophaga sp. H7]